MKSSLRTLTGAVAAVLLAGALADARGAAQPSAATTASNKRIVREAFDRWATGGTDVFDVLAPNVVWTIEGSGPTAGTYRGKQAFLDRASAPLAARRAALDAGPAHGAGAVGRR